MALFYRMARYPDLDLLWMIGSLCYVGALPFHDSLALCGALKEYGCRLLWVVPLHRLAVARVPWFS